MSGAAGFLTTLICLFALGFGAAAYELGWTTLAWFFWGCACICFAGAIVDALEDRT